MSLHKSLTARVNLFSMLLWFLILLQETSHTSAVGFELRKITLSAAALKQQAIV